jgi:hypothetical protein
MNNKNYKKLLDDRIKPIPKSTFTQNLVNEYTIITQQKEEKKEITSQKDLLVKLDETKPNINKYNAIEDERKQEEEIRINEYNKYKNILEEQKRKTQELFNRLNV